VHRFNLLQDDAGALYLLDWEGAMLAPREHDMIFFTRDDEHFDAFLTAYQAINGPTRLEPDLFSFYFHRRNLEDLTDWIYRILYENQEMDQDQADLMGIREDCLRWWDDLDAGAGLQRVLAAHQRS
jgi:spectinomycin phosphotransferase